MLSTGRTHYNPSKAHENPPLRPDTTLRVAGRQNGRLCPLMSGDVVEAAGMRLGGQQPASPHPSRPRSPAASRPRPGPSQEVRRRYEETYQQQRSKPRERAAARAIGRADEELPLLLPPRDGDGSGGGGEEDGGGGWALAQVPDVPRARGGGAAAKAMLRAELVFADAQAAPPPVDRLAGPAKAEPTPTVERPASAGRPVGEPTAGNIAGRGVAEAKSASGGKQEDLYRRALAWFDDEFGDLAAAASAQARAAATTATSGKGGYRGHTPKAATSTATHRPAAYAGAGGGGGGGYAGDGGGSSYYSSSEEDCFGSSTSTSYRAGGRHRGDWGRAMGAPSGGREGDGGHWA